MSILVLIEHHHGKLAASNARVMAAAQQLAELTHNSDIQVLVAGSDIAEVAQQAACLSGVSSVLMAEEQRYAGLTASPVAALLAEQGKKFTHVLAAASSEGKDILPRAAALLGVSQVSDIVSIVDASTYKRPIYAGSLIATVRNSAPVQVMTVRPTAFDPVDEQPPARIDAIQPVGETLGVQVVSEVHDKSDRPDLTTARVVVSGGRGMGSKENFALVEQLADKLHGAVGASRAAVDAGYVPNDAQVGQTGKVVAPDLYIAVGISGAVQHLAGMQGAKIVVAINQDEEAPIFANADYGLVGDLFEIVPELTKKL